MRECSIQYYTVYVYTKSAAAVCAGADPTGVGGVYSSLCRELHVRISFAFFATYFSMPISVSQI